MKKIFIALAAGAVGFNVLAASCAAQEYRKAVSKTVRQGENVTVTVKLDLPARVFGYQCLLSFDPDMLEFEGVSKRYFPSADGEIKENGTLYKSGETPVGYENIKPEEGKVYYLSSAVKGTVIKSRDEVVQFSFKSKTGGESFITIADEKAMVESEERLVGSKTYFNVVSPELTDVSKTYSDYTEKSSAYDLSGAKKIKVNYVDGQTDIKVKNGKIICTADNPFGDEAVPAVVKISFDGTQNIVKTVWADKDKIRFAVQDFGTYYIVPLYPVIRDMPSGDAADAVKAFAAAGVISGGNDISYRPDDKITKAEYIKMLAEACGFTDTSAKCSYNDVSLTDWFYPYAASAEQVGVTDKTSYFNPNGTVSQTEAAEMAKKAVGMQEIAENGAYETEITRAEAAEMIYTALKDLLG